MIQKSGHIKAASIAVIAIVLLISPGHAEWGKQQVDAALERARKMEKHIVIPDVSRSVNLHRITEQCPGCKSVMPDSEVADTRGISGKDLYLLVSSSVPMSTLQAYARQIQKQKHKDTTMVLKGFVGGIQKIRPTLEFIRKVRCDDTLDVPFEINPEMFEKYDVTQVPAMIWQTRQDSFQITGAIDLDEAKKRFKKAASQR